ncbi:MAG: methylated-DNA--[protein]-cysteine S-methyltransferase [Moraxella sp.]|nr:methylated-DNA--[protein]-cysteine S-methyltransferase [Moraxella sp.]
MIAIASYQPPLALPKITLIVRDDRLIALDWHTQKSQRLLGEHVANFDYLSGDQLDERLSGHRLLKQVMTQLNEYFCGLRMQFDIPLDLSCGTPFEQAVWQQLQQIPCGQTISYATLAQNIGKPTAYRACANANGKNPISIIIPCHRVIASNGSIGGYTGGVHIKQTLLELERGALL